ncbi:MAG: helix-turn-helix transcriptional regulator [Clostridiales bacterium]|nr:helix-turn-helix transcriptional regulator [Clostridiales bacterium]
MKNRIRDYRLAAGMTQAQLAELARVTPRTILSLESGRYSPSLSLAYRLARLFGTTVEELCCLEENYHEDL